MFRLAREAMRTRFEAAIADHADPADLRAAVEDAFVEIERIELQLSAYREDAELFRVNRDAAKAPVRLDARLFAFLKRAQQLSALTNGAFDMSVGPLMRAWKLAGNAGASGTAPSDSELAAALKLSGMNRVLELDAASSSVRFTVPGAWLDPGAIGKGYALERAADLLRDAGIRNALIHGGTSTAVAWGDSPEGPGWRIAIQHPTQAKEHLAQVVLKDAALSVSAFHGKTFRADGKVFGHVIDPRSGRPVESNVLAAVVTKHGTDADALSTAALVRGSGGLAELSKTWPDASFLVAMKAGDSLRCAKLGDAFQPCGNE